jgi:hypothetical protein
VGAGAREVAGELESIQELYYSERDVAGEVRGGLLLQMA